MWRGTFEAVAGGMLGVALVGAAPAGARTLAMCTPPLAPDASGYLYCTVRATSRVPIGIVAHIMSGAGVDVTEFGTGFRASPEVTGDGYYAEETAGSLADDARYCTATVDGVQQKRDVHVALKAFDTQGNAVATVTGAPSPRKGPCM